MAKATSQRPTRLVIIVEDVWTRLVLNAQATLVRWHATLAVPVDSDTVVLVRALPWGPEVYTYGYTRESGTPALTGIHSSVPGASQWDVGVLPSRCLISAKNKLTPNL